MNPDRYATIYNSKYDGTQSVFDGSATTAAAVPYAHTSPSTLPLMLHMHFIQLMRI